MDEATANIDHLTDSLIQKMIKTEFQNSTVITIAHRLHTVIEYDRILVLADGRIAEFDSPRNLLANPKGFHLISGIVNVIRSVLWINCREWSRFNGTYEILSQATLIRGCFSQVSMN